MTEVAVHSTSAVGDRELVPLAAGVQISGLYKNFGLQPVLRGVDLTVPKGSVTAILGPSGSGKTTLLRLLAGFDRPDSGTISIDGRIVDGPGRHLPPGVRGIGYVPQEGSLFPHLDVRTNVGFGLPRAGRRQRVDQLLEMTGLSQLGRRFPHQLSGGEQQRVALARALAPDPSLVLLDEPFSSLDAFLRTSVRLDVAHILDQAATTTLIVTHDQDEALSMADQVAVFRAGRVAQAGSPEDIYTRPADAALARFVGDANLLAGTVRGGRVETPLGSLPLARRSAAGLSEGTEVLVLVRPEQIAFEDAGRSDAVRGVVTRCDYHGHDTIITVDAGMAKPINVRCIGPAAVGPGDAVALRAEGPVAAWDAAERDS